MNYKVLLALALVMVSATALFSQSKAEVTSDTQNFREQYKANFLAEERSPFYQDEEGLQQLDFYKPKAAYRVNCTFEATPDALPFDMATYSGAKRKYIQYGWLSFNLKGKERKIAVYQSLRLRQVEEYKDYLFIPFKDKTNNKATYGGGRYIDLKSTDIIDGKVTLDFNQSYNPYCAFKGGYSCPIPPVANHLDWSVKAGEKKFKGNH